MMEFKFEITFIVILTTMAILISLIFTIRSIRENTKVRRAELLKDFILKFHESKDLKDIFFRIEWSRFTFDLKSFPTSEDERKLTYLIEFLDVISHYEQTGILKLQDLQRNLGYIAVRVTQDKEVQKYFQWLDGWFRDKDVVWPSQNMRKLAQKIKKLESETAC